MDGAGLANVIVAVTEEAVWPGAAAVVVMGGAVADAWGSGIKPEREANISATFLFSAEGALGKPPTPGVREMVSLVAADTVPATAAVGGGSPFVPPLTKVTIWLVEELVPGIDPPAAEVLVPCWA